MTNIVALADKSSSSKMWTVEDALRDALESVQSGERKATKGLFLMLDTADDNYDVGWTNSGLSTSECIALLEVAKAQMLIRMNIISEPG